MNKLPIFICGLPRSGTTWIGKVLSQAEGTHYIFEPDNEKFSPVGWLMKENMHRFPYIRADGLAEEYEYAWRKILWGECDRFYINSITKHCFRKLTGKLEAAIGEKTGLVYFDTNLYGVSRCPKLTKPYFGSSHKIMKFFVKMSLGKRATIRRHTRIIVKSVHAPLCLEWLYRRIPIKLVVVLRNPFSIFASYKRMKMPDKIRNILYQENLRQDLGGYLPSNIRPISGSEEIAFQICLMYKVIEKQIERNKDWLIVSHDKLCMGPLEGFRSIYDLLGLSWDPKVENMLTALNQEGKGYVPSRITKSQPFKWHTELTVNEEKSVKKWIRLFELDDMCANYFHVAI